MNSFGRGLEDAKKLRQARDVSAIAFVALAQSGQLDDATVTEHPGLFAEWDEHWTGGRGTILRYGGQLYRALHDTGPGQNADPETTPGLWQRIGNPADEWPEWVPYVPGRDDDAHDGRGASRRRRQ